MEGTIKNNSSRNKGGRPRKEVKKDQLMAFKCTISERRIIEDKAAQVRRNISEYMRLITVNGKIDSRKIPPPPEFFRDRALASQLAANLNQITKKSNSNLLTAMDRAEARLLYEEIRRLINLKNEAYYGGEDHNG